jgi:dTDP-4-dehydrorhamnose reductase
MKKLLITGVSGFLGGHVFTQAESSFQCIGTYFSSASPQHIANWTRLDLRDFFKVYQLVSDFQPDVIIHAAANSNLDDCETHPEDAQAANVQATANLVSVAGQLDIRFIHVSTDMVFDGAGSLYKESDATNPLSVYGQTKLQSEQIVLKHENSVVVRSALIYGRRKIGGNSFSLWIENNLRQKKPTPLYTDQFRSPILAENLAELVLELCDSETTGIFHAGGGNRIDRYSFGQQMCDILGYDAALLRPVSMEDHNFAAPRPKDISLSIKKLEQICKTPILTTEQGLMRMNSC